MNEQFKGILANRPDICLIDEDEKVVLIIDPTITNEEHMFRAFSEKIHKYNQLQIKLKRIYNAKTSIIIPIVISTNGLVYKQSLKLLTQYNITLEWEQLIRKNIIRNMQSICKYLQYVGNSSGDDSDNNMSESNANSEDDTDVE